MPRPKSIDKATILAAAEELITETRGLSFTMDMVAAKAGISKGGLTYTYPSKDGLVQDLLKRELSRFIAERESFTAGDQPVDRLRAHVRASAEQKHIFQTRAAHLMAALSHEAGNLERVQSFYREIFDLAEPSTPEGRRARQAFLAIEGLFLLRGLGLMQVSDDEWDDVFAQALECI
ncbi:TetR family transcriptional regulator [Pseudaminobacter sp. 19-2017]|uniref:TetR family transcriptional regulator n=1 Tax=Pseudaminobacter soli (ex Zhang et al. 2022) TaxID=2831468 RepID=A0A942E7H2_9HYPH|nr:TetR/AcrR family transcriptional regulator [Pseudaminobacter soli]MBS3652538.1 TetR family transcriptional regulator [Pseudaminobacter soli]